MKSRDPWRELTQRIPFTPSTHHGLTWLRPVLPEEVIIFARHDKQALSPTDTKHFHNRYVLIMALEGGGYVGVDENIIRLNEKQAMVIFPYQFHFYPQLDQNDINWFFITFDLPDPSRLETLRGRVMDIPRQSFELLERILWAVTAQGFTFLKRNHYLLHDISALFETFIDVAEEFPSVQARSPQALELLEKINARIFPGKPDAPSPQIAQLAKNLGFSESHLRAEFRRLTGISLGKYLRRMRIARACARLSATHDSVAQIAEECGFESLYSFSRTFKNEQGSSPLAYRKECDHHRQKK